MSDSSGIESAIAGGISSPSQDFSSFMGAITNASSNPLYNLPTIAAQMAINNAYAKQNVLQAMQARPDPVLSFDWIGVILDSGFKSTGLPWQYIDAITAPSREVASHELHFNGLDKKFAAKPSVGNIQIKLYTDRAATTFNYAELWFNATYRRDGYYNLPSKYKKDIAVFVLDSRRQVVVDFR